MASQRQMRKTRFVCISDTHNCTVKLPKGDVLVHCGDLTNQGSFTELSKQISWLEKADFECKLVIAGNHDMTLDSDFYAHHGFRRHNNNPQSPEACQSLLTNSDNSLTYLNHEARKITLTSPSGPRTTFTVFGSPYTLEEEEGKGKGLLSSSGRRREGKEGKEGVEGEEEEEEEEEREGEKEEKTKWAFQYPPVSRHSGGNGDDENLSSSSSSSTAAGADPVSSSSSSLSSRRQPPWDDIPPETDILITHGPPYGHLDRAPSFSSSSSCLPIPPTPTGVVEEVVEKIPSSTSRSYHHQNRRRRRRRRRGCPALARAIRERIRPRLVLCGHVHEGRGCERVIWGESSSSSSSSSSSAPPAAPEAKKEVVVKDTLDSDIIVTRWEDPGVSWDDDDGKMKENAKISLVDLIGKKRGGGRGEEGRRLDNNGSEGDGSGGRRETCIVNCAIMTASYPHRGRRRGGGGPRPTNKPIVVDILLPVCGEEEEEKEEGGGR